MSTSLLYHGFGIVGYQYVHQKVENGGLVFRIEQPKERLRCAHCGSDHVMGQGGVEREFRTVSIGSKPVSIRLKVPRVYCSSCLNTRQVKIGFADL